jgi:Predicted oxidoreductases (related to aryl-alcohol dehydrogenases)
VDVNMVNINHNLLLHSFLKYNKMTLLSWSPLHGGLLTGKYKKGEKPPSGTRMGDRGFFSHTLMRKGDRQ